MSKLKRDIATWSRRVMMSKERVWAVVEGKSVDAPFYEGVLEQVFGSSSVEVIKAEDIEIDGSTAGGKQHALKAFEYFNSEGALRQKNKSTAVDWVFFLDRDDDDFVGSLVSSPHIIYTRHADVEAEVLANTETSSVLRIAYSLPSSAVRTIEIESPLTALAELWEEWILLRLASSACGVSGARFSQMSQVNSRQFGAYDPHLFAEIVSRVTESIDVDTWNEHLAAARAFLESRRVDGETGRSVKGKWVPGYLDFLLRTQLVGVPLSNIRPSQILAVGLARLNFSEPWVDYYRESLRPLLEDEAGLASTRDHP